MRHEPAEIQKIAAAAGARQVWHRPEQSHLRFAVGKDTYVDVWYSKMTVGTVVTHPKRGRGQLFRRQVDLGMLAKILRNPRVHTGEGYYSR